ncbi:MAG: heavy-metal-associated domain-containing protein [Planctomycetaceae bacterium]
MKLALLSIVMGTMAVSVQAGQAKIEGTHLCCGACVKSATESLSGVTGVTNVVVDKATGIITFDADDRKTARQGLNALAKGGFGGKATFDGKGLPMPKGAEADATGDEVKIAGLHNCCPGCESAITDALKGVDGVTEVKCDKKSCTVKGTKVSHTALIDALHEAGLHGRIGMPGKKKDKAAE